MDDVVLALVGDVGVDLHGDHIPLVVHVLQVGVPEGRAEVGELGVEVLRACACV